jgi:RIO kinase 1
MSYVGDRGAPAPRLHEYAWDDQELEALWERVHDSLEHMLYRDVVHGDLSAYNVLVWDGDIVVIDFHRRSTLGRTATPRRSSSATRRIGQWFEHQGLHLPWERIAADLWTAWNFADLVPEELRGLTI